MRTYSLIGKSLGYSFSSRYFSEKFFKEGIETCRYINLEIDNISDLKNKIYELEISGFNVTIPYKEKVIPFLDFTSENVKEIGSVNTVKIIDDKLYGYNTDWQGVYMYLLKNKITSLSIYGNGNLASIYSFNQSRRCWHVQ